MSVVATLATYHAAGNVAAVRVADTPEVELVDTGERMTVEAFFRRYPAGVLIPGHAPQDRRYAAVGGMDSPGHALRGRGGSYSRLCRPQTAYRRSRRMRSQP